MTLLEQKHPARRALAAAITGLLALMGIVHVAAPAHAAEVTEYVDGMRFIADNDDPAAGAFLTSYEPEIGGTDVVIPSHVTIGGIEYAVVRIGGQAFSNDGLTSVSIPSTVTIIGELAFNGNQLTEVTVPDSVTVIRESAFRDNALASVALGNSITEIGPRAFYQNALTHVTIPDSVMTIGAQAFQGVGLTSVTLGSSVTQIGAAAFAENNLTGLTIPDSVELIGQSAFQWNSLTSVALGSSVFEIGLAAFYQNQLTEVTIPDSVVTIGTQAFAVNDLTSVFLGESVYEINASAFASNDLTAVTIPDSVATIGVRAFTNNPGLAAVYFESEVAPTIIAAGNDGSFGQAAGKILYYPWDATGFSTPVWQGYNTEVLAPVEMFTVTFDSRGGSMVDPVAVRDGDTVAAPVDPTRADHWFTGWYTDAATTQPFDFATPITSDLTLYAGWESQVIGPETRTVTFDSTGGSSVPAVTVEVGDTITAPADPTRAGYSFTGWFTDAAGTEAFDFATPVTSDLRLYAGWKADVPSGTSDAPAPQDRKDAALVATGTGALPGLLVGGALLAACGAVLLLRRQRSA